jgi:hypothetical protein
MDAAAPGYCHGRGAHKRANAAAPMDGLWAPSAPIPLPALPRNLPCSSRRWPPLPSPRPRTPTVTTPRCPATPPAHRFGMSARVRRGRELRAAGKPSRCSGRGMLLLQRAQSAVGGVSRYQHLLLRRGTSAAGVHLLLLQTCAQSPDMRVPSASTHAGARLRCHRNSYRCRCC